jgi:thioredoxin reductase
MSSYQPRERTRSGALAPRRREAYRGDMNYDVVIVGGGPAGLSAALALGRARRRVLLCDAGPRRNAAAVQIQNFVTRDGTPPAEFRRIGREQLEPYPNVDARDTGVRSITGERGAFDVSLEGGETVVARRILLATGMVDVLPEIEGFRELWGHSIIICPYCHGWEEQDRRFGFLTPSPEMAEFALLLRGWSLDVVLFTDGRHEIPAEARAQLATAGVPIEERRIARLTGRDGELERVELADGNAIPLDILFARPPQRQVALVESLGLAAEPGGYLTVSNPQRETSIPGIYAGGDLITPMQAAIFAAAAGTQAAAMLNHDLTAELALSGALR